MVNSISTQLATNTHCIGWNHDFAGMNARFNIVLALSSLDSARCSVFSYDTCLVGLCGNAALVRLHGAVEVLDRAVVAHP